MKIICFIVVLIKITKEVHSLKCHVNEKGDEPVETECKDTNNKLCMYDKFGKDDKMIARACMSNKDDKGKDLTPGCEESITTTTCYCDKDNCNHACTAKNCKKGSGPADPKTCEADCKAPGEEDQKTTQGGAAATGEGDQKATGDGAKTTGAANGTANGSQRFAESNQYLIAFLIIATLVTFIKNY